MVGGGGVPPLVAFDGSAEGSGKATPAAGAVALAVSPSSAPPLVESTAAVSGSIAVPLEAGAAMAINSGEGEGGEGGEGRAAGEDGGGGAGPMAMAAKARVLRQARVRFCIQIVSRTGG